MRNVLAVLIAVTATAGAGCALEETDDAQADDPVTGSLSEEDSAASEEALMLAGSCSTSTTNGGHTAVASCSGYLNTGTFRVLTTCCLSSCGGTIGGSWAYLAGGTSTAGCGSAYATNVRIEYGPAGG